MWELEFFWAFWLDLKYIYLLATTIVINSDDLGQSFGWQLGKYIWTIIKQNGVRKDW